MNQTIVRGILVGSIALVLNIVFLWYVAGDIYHAITQAHGHIGYQLYTNNSIWMSSSLSDYVHKRHTGTEFFEYAAVRTQTFDAPSAPFPVNDTIGYGLLLGLIWKITNSLKVSDVQWLHIILYLFSLILVYQISSFLFNGVIAWWCVYAHILFLPLIALNVQAVRDVWAYYASLLLLWGVVRCLYYRYSVPELIMVGIGFAVCQWMRPSVFLALGTMSMALLIIAAMAKVPWRKSVACIFLLCSTNIVIFWIPFIWYNSIAYGRVIVGPVGQDLLEGLGEFDNPWGYQLSDEFVAQYIGKKYHVTYGTPEFDDKAYEEFAQAYQENPWIYWRNILKRIPQLVLPSLPWLFPKKSPFVHLHGWQQKLQAIMSSGYVLGDFFVRHVLVWLLLVLGYLGMIIAWRHGHFIAVILACSIIIGGFAKLPSHIEYRYLVPYYWVFALFVGYVCWYFSSNKSHL